MTDPILSLPVTMDHLRGYAAEVYSANGRCLATVWCLPSDSKDMTDDERTACVKARAEEIVRRVNAHDELVAFVRRVAEYPVKRSDEWGVESIRAEAKDVLAKLEAHQ